VSYAAIVVARSAQGWTASEVDLDEVEDVDGAAELAREVSAGAHPTVLFIEEEDEYLAILRVDGDFDDPRVFVSDAKAVDNFRLAALLLDGIEPEPDDEDDEDAPAGHDSEPAGDVDLLSDLGTSARSLVALCDQEGTLPSDVVAAVCENAGCLAELEMLREA
jgi:putative tRNA adenosine deaminase-associated protein